MKLTTRKDTINIYGFFSQKNARYEPTLISLQFLFVNIVYIFWTKIILDLNFVSQFQAETNINYLKTNQKKDSDWLKSFKNIKIKQSCYNFKTLKNVF